MNHNTHTSHDELNFNNVLINAIDDDLRLRLIVTDDYISRVCEILMDKDEIRCYRT